MQHESNRTLGRIWLMRRRNSDDYSSNNSHHLHKSLLSQLQRKSLSFHVVHINFSVLLFFHTVERQLQITDLRFAAFVSIYDDDWCCWSLHLYMTGDCFFSCLLDQRQYSIIDSGFFRPNYFFLLFGKFLILTFFFIPIGQLKCQDLIFKLPKVNSYVRCQYNISQLLIFLYS